MLKPLAIAACVVLGACAPGSERFQIAPQTRVTPDALSGALTPMTVVWHLNTPDATGDACHGLGAIWGNVGCARYQTANPKDGCVIYTPLPFSGRDPLAMNIIYHELLHCELGAWHE